MTLQPTHGPRKYALACLFAGCLAAHAQAQSFVPSGQIITPAAAPGAVFQRLNPGLPDHQTYGAGQAIKTALSPDGSTLLVLTSGYNNLSVSSGKGLGNFEPSASNEYVFVFNVTGANVGRPALQQVIQIPDTFVGLVFSPDGTKFYASGGVDDVVYTYAMGSGGWTLARSVTLGHAPTKSQVKKSLGFDSGGIGFQQPPTAANLAVSADGSLLIVANIYNNSISAISTASNSVLWEYNLQPFNTTPASGKGGAGGERPFGVVIAGTTVYVSSLRDREVVVLNIAGANSTTPPVLVARIPLPGNPNNMVLDDPRQPTKLYVTQDNSDDVAVIDLADNAIIEEIDARGPAGVAGSGERYTGAASNNLAIHDKTLYVTNGGQNAVAVIPLAGPAPHSAAGLIPTGWYPQAVSVAKDGTTLYVVNGKSDGRPNPENLTSSTYALKGTKYPGGNNRANNLAYASNQYAFQLQPAGLLSLPVPDAAALGTLTAQVATNNFYNRPETPQAASTMAELHQVIRHVIYIIKENRTFDQVLGDLGNGSNGNPFLAVFGQRVTPNLHRIARDFVTLDDFYDPAEVSGNGWEWSTAARETDFNTKTIPLNYGSSPAPSALNLGGRGGPYDAEGQNSDVDVGIPTTAEREVAEPLYGIVTQVFPGGTANFFPGTNNDAAPDGPDGDVQTGYLWDAALRAGLTVRNYGFYLDLGPYSLPASAGGIPPTDPTPYKNNDVQARPTNPTLNSLTDLYFRGFDNNYPDLFRFNEWNREFQLAVTNKALPNLTLLRLMHDHMGNFTSQYNAPVSQGGYGLNFPEAQQADDDYAVGLVAQAVAQSPYKDDTLIFVVEDDPQDGPDHVDQQRSTGYVIGPYVRHHAIVSTRYTTVNMLRTIEDILGTDHLNLNDAFAAPMYDVFDLSQEGWSFLAKPSPFLRGTVDGTGIADFSDNDPALPVQPAAWWGQMTQGFDWSKEDRIPADLFNRILWKGFRGDAPYPTPARAQR